MTRTRLKINQKRWNPTYDRVRIDKERIDKERKMAEEDVNKESDSGSSLELEIG